MPLYSEVVLCLLLLHICIEFFYVLGIPSYEILAPPLPPAGHDRAGGGLGERMRERLGDAGTGTRRVGVLAAWQSDASQCVD